MPFQNGIMLSIDCCSQFGGGETDFEPIQPVERPNL